MLRRWVIYMCEALLEPLYFSAPCSFFLRPHTTEHLTMAEKKSDYYQDAPTHEARRRSTVASVNLNRNIDAK